MFLFSTSHVSSSGSATTTVSEVEERRIQVLSCEINHGVSLESIKEDTEGRVLNELCAFVDGSRVSAHQVEGYLAQIRSGSLLIHEKITVKWVRVDTILDESDMVGKAMMDLVPSLNHFMMDRKLRSREGGGIADDAPEFCDIKIDHMIGSPFTPRWLQDQSNTNNDSFACTCSNHLKMSLLIYKHSLCHHSGDSSVGRASD
ncbi:hypothetical protein OIU85_000048 [Salix viminalis]|uniref:Uncharacterized protein n=1 Tax=Salix viminalis TaxID=40686 RepID=A0A6N2KEM0_SALVM|nr:hypothetical protein OIU85_000048 [Salix viminalis]